jgi:hypothetical protein
LTRSGKEAEEKNDNKMKGRSYTKVTMTDKDCSEIAALSKDLPDADHILCHFHVLKAVDAWLKTLKGFSKEKKNMRSKKNSVRFYMKKHRLSSIDPKRTFVKVLNRPLIFKFIEKFKLKFDALFINRGRYHRCVFSGQLVQHK